MTSPDLSLMVEQHGDDALSEAREDIEKYAARLAKASLDFAAILAHKAVSDAVAARMKQQPAKGEPK